MWLNSKPVSCNVCFKVGVKSKTVGIHSVVSIADRITSCDSHTKISSHAAMYINNCYWCFRMVMVWWEVTICLCSLNSQQDCQKHLSKNFNFYLTITFFIIHKLLTIYGNCIILTLFLFLKVWIQSWNDTSCFSWLKQEYCEGIWWVTAMNQSTLLSTCSICT